MTRGFRLLAAVFAAVFSFPAAASAFTRAGDLDLSWGSTGIFQTVVADVGKAGAPAAVGVIPKRPGQPDDLVVVAGTAMRGGKKVFAVVRYHADGTFDTSFGTGGVFYEPIGSGDATLTSMVVLPSGFLVLGGTAVDGSGNHVFALARVTDLGKPDLSFNNPNGVVLSQLGTPTTGPGDAGVEAVTLAQGSAGQVLAAGYALDGDNYKLALAKYGQDGDLDSSSLQSAGTGVDWRGYTVNVTGDGGALVAGDTSDGQWGIARFASSLTGLAGGFGTGGKAFTPMGDGSDAHARALLIEPNNGFVVAGYAKDGGVNKFALARYDALGSLDPSFGGGGKVLTQVAAGGSRAGYLGESFGRLLVAGDASDGSNYGFGLASYDSSGNLVPSFGSGGLVFTPFATQAATDLPRGLLQPDTNLVLAGTALNGPIGKFELARYITQVPGSSGGGQQGAFGGQLGQTVSGNGGGNLAGILIGRGKLRGRSRAVLKLKCVRTKQFCRGRLTLRISRRVGPHHRRRSFQVGSVKFNVKSGKTGTLKLRLSRRMRHVLRTRHRIHTVARARAKDAGGHVYSDRLGFVLKTKTKKRH